MNINNLKKEKFVNVHTLYKIIIVLKIVEIMFGKKLIIMAIVEIHHHVITVNI